MRDRFLSQIHLIIYFELLKVTILSFSFICVLFVFLSHFSSLFFVSFVFFALFLIYQLRFLSHLNKFDNLQCKFYTDVFY